jgi:hydrogenase-4 component B
MLILAISCVLVGVLPQVLVPLAVKATLATGLLEPNVSIDPLLEGLGNITRVVVIFVIGLVAMIGLRWLLYRGKTVTRSVTWGCGYSQPTVRMQYTGSSYVASILTFFRALAPLRIVYDASQGRFPKRRHYHSHVDDLAEHNAGRLLVQPLMAVFDRARWIQNGDLHLYIGYILLAIVILLVFVWRG